MGGGLVSLQPACEHGAFVRSQKSLEVGVQVSGWETCQQKPFLHLVMQAHPGGDVPNRLTIIHGALVSASRQESYGVKVTCLYRLECGAGVFKWLAHQERRHLLPQTSSGQGGFVGSAFCEGPGAQVL